MALYIQGSYVKPKKTTYIPSSYYSSAPKAPVQALWSDKLPSGGTPSVYNTTGSFKTPTQTVAQIPTGLQNSGFSKGYSEGLYGVPTSAPSFDVDLSGIWEQAGLMADNEVNPQPQR